MPPHLRPFADSDLPALVQIDRACFVRGIAYSKTAFRCFLSLPGTICLVVEAQESLLGFVLASADPLLAHLITLDVLPVHRRQGLGSLLLETLEANLLSAGVRTVELETATDNRPAIAFWQRHGYRSVGVLSRYYLGRIDAFFMRKPLLLPREISA